MKYSENTSLKLLCWERSKVKKILGLYILLFKSSNNYNMLFNPQLRYQNKFTMKNFKFASTKIFHCKTKYVEISNMFSFLWSLLSRWSKIVFLFNFWLNVIIYVFIINVKFCCIWFYDWATKLFQNLHLWPWFQHLQVLLKLMKLKIENWY